MYLTANYDETDGTDEAPVRKSVEIISTGQLKRLFMGLDFGVHNLELKVIDGFNIVEVEVKRK